MTGDLIPISDEQAKLATKALDVLQGFGGFLRQVLGTVPEDLVGVLGGDWLKVRRAENLANMLKKAEERLEARDVVETKPANLTLALPLFEAASNEGREELQDLWACLLAAAVDPKRANDVRAQYVEVVKRMEPLDALVLQKMRERVDYDGAIREHFARAFEVNEDQVQVSFDHLSELGCVSQAVAGRPTTTALGKELLRVLSD